MKSAGTNVLVRATNALVSWKGTAGNGIGSGTGLGLGVGGEFLQSSKAMVNEELLI